jgi:hypothetical protein
LLTKANVHPTDGLAGIRREAIWGVPLRQTGGKGVDEIKEHCEA